MSRRATVTLLVMGEQSTRCLSSVHVPQRLRFRPRPHLSSLSLCVMSPPHPSPFFFIFIIIFFIIISFLFSSPPVFVFCFFLFCFVDAVDGAVCARAVQDQVQQEDEQAGHDHVRHCRLKHACMRLCFGLLRTMIRSTLHDASTEQACQTRKMAPY